MKVFVKQNKIKFLITFLVSTLMISCSDNKLPECSKFKIGVFYYQGIENGTLYKNNVQRNDTLQTEINELTGDTSILTIKWIDACSYELAYIKISHSNFDSLTLVKNKLVIRTEILKTTDRYYTFQAVNNLNDLVLEDTMWISH